MFTVKRSQPPAADCLGAKTHGVSPKDAGDILGERLIYFMKATGMPSGLEAIGYTPKDIPDLVKGNLSFFLFPI